MRDKETLQAIEIGEIERTSERYRMLPIGGRIKTAGVSIDHIYKPAQPMIDDPTSPEAAFATSQAFAHLKENPQKEVLAGFFPSDKIAMKTALVRGVGIYRLTIKTDQGPGGNVGRFRIEPEGSSRLDGRIVAEEGVAVVERFLQNRFQQVQLSAEDAAQLREASDAVNAHYEKGKLYNAFQSILMIRALGERYGIETSRRAGVGRGEFFFFRPVQTQQDVVIGSDLSTRISEETERVISTIEKKATATKFYLQKGMSLDEAKQAAQTAYTMFSADVSGLQYFQPDVLIRNDGSFDIERINFPDLGLFLTKVQMKGENQTLQALQNMNTAIADEVLDVVAQDVDITAFLMTREAVLENDEDTLERLEIEAIGQGLQERGKDVIVTSLRQVDALPQGSTIVLLNISAEGEDYERLLSRVALGELRCYPDPFIKLYEKEATTFKRLTLSGERMDAFLQAATPSHLNKPIRVHRKYTEIQDSLQQAGVDSDIIYFSTSATNGVFVPTFRYDVKSFSEIVKTVEFARQQGKQVDSITAIPVPFKREDAIMYGKDGPRLAVCRFMFVRK